LPVDHGSLMGELNRKRGLDYRCGFKTIG
jgi:hypothetical protein